MCFGVWEGTEFPEKTGERGTWLRKKVKRWNHIFTPVQQKLHNSLGGKKKEDDYSENKKAACAPAGIAPVPPASLLLWSASSSLPVPPSQSKFLLSFLLFPPLPHWNSFHLLSVSFSCYHCLLAPTSHPSFLTFFSSPLSLKIAMYRFILNLFYFFLIDFSSCKSTWNLNLAHVANYYNYNITFIITN